MVRRMRLVSLMGMDLAFFAASAPASVHDHLGQAPPRVLERIVDAEKKAEGGCDVFRPALRLVGSRLDGCAHEHDGDVAVVLVGSAVAGAAGESGEVHVL